MSGNPNWNPPLQTSSVRFPRKAPEIQTIPANSTTRQRYGAPFQPVYPNPITQIPSISAGITLSSAPILQSTYILSNGTGLAYPYNVNRQTVRGVPIPTVVNVQTADHYLAFAVNFAYVMSGTDHFVFTFTNINTGELTVKNYQPASRYLVSGLLPGIAYTLVVAPNVNGITYPASPSIGPFSITAISEKNVQLVGLNLVGGDRSATISFTNTIPGPEISLPVTNIAIDDNFFDYQLRLDVSKTPLLPNGGFVNISNLTNGSSYVFTVTPYTVVNGIYEYGRPSTLLPYIPGPPSDLYTSSITASGNTLILNSSYDTVFHPTPVSNTFSLYSSTLTTICSFVSQTTNYIKDLSTSYVSFTTSTSLFTLSDIDYLTSNVSSSPGSIQVDLINNLGLWYSFPLSNISTGGLGYIFGNNNFSRTVNLYSNDTSYNLIFRSVNLGTSISTSTYNPPQTSYIYPNLPTGYYTVVSKNYANGLTSLRNSYSTIATGAPIPVANLTGQAGNSLVSISFSDFNYAQNVPRPTSFLYTDNYGNTYTTVNSNTIINGLTDGSTYTFGVQSFANNLYSVASFITLTPNVQPPTNIFVSDISAYNVTVSFAPAIGGADYYLVDNQRGLTTSLTPYIFSNLTANISYFFNAKSFVYNTPIYTISQSLSANLIQEISTGYVNFLLTPSAFPYGMLIKQRIFEFVKYNYTITSSGQTSIPIQTNINSTVSGTSLLTLSGAPSIALTLNALASGNAVIASIPNISYTVTSITTVSDSLGNVYNSFNGGPSSLSNLTGQQFTLTIFPVSNTLTFPITSVNPIYDRSGNITFYNIQNPNVIKSTVTFSGVSTFNTTISANVPFYSGMVPISYSGSISSAPSSPTTTPAYVGPPSTVVFTGSAYYANQVSYNVSYTGYVVPSYYYYIQASGNISGIALGPNITISQLVNGNPYSFYFYAFANRVYSTLSALTNTFTLSTNSPRNINVYFSNLTPYISFIDSTPSAELYYMNVYSNSYNPTSTPVQTITNASPGTYSFLPLNQDSVYSFSVYGVLYGICSLPTLFNGGQPIVAGTPRAPINFITTLSTNKVIFNWSSGNTVFNENYKIVEYFSNNPTGGVWSNIQGYTYTISYLQTVSSTITFTNAQWLELNLGYSAFALNKNNNISNFITNIGNQYNSNLIYLTFQQSGGLTYTFPLTNISTYNNNSNLYYNPNYPKSLGDIFNTTYSLSITYSYGTGPRNYGLYNYEISASANLTYSLSTSVNAQMYIQPVSGIPTVSVSGTTATISFAQTNLTGTTYIVTNNYGSNVSVSPYEFRNLLTTSSYYFYVVASNGPFVSASSQITPIVYVGPPRTPLVSTSYYGLSANVYATDTTLSLSTVYFDSGKQNTGCNITTASHANTISISSGGFWDPNLGNGGIKDSLTGFVPSVTGYGSVVYSNDGNINAMYQFTVIPSTGSMLVSLSSYLLNITGQNVYVSNGNTQVYSGIVNTPSYNVQIVSLNTGFSIQSDSSSFYYTSVPALTDQLTISLASPASFYDFKVYNISNVGVQTASYTISDQFGKVYSSNFAYPIYNLSGVTYIYKLNDVSINLNLTLGVTPFGDNIYGTPGNAALFIYTEPPGPVSATILDRTATVTICSKPVTSSPVDSYSLITISGGQYYSTLTSNAVVGQNNYVFTVTNLVNHRLYNFIAYTTYLGISSQIQSNIGPFEAGYPYSITNLNTSLINPNSVNGTYTLSASINPGLNTSNTIITLSLNILQVNRASRSLKATDPQNYLFTVSSGFVYNLSSFASMNGVTIAGPSVNICTAPFPPSNVTVTISSSNQGTTYNGIITKSDSPTLGVSYVYKYSSNNGSTCNDAAANGTFPAVYGSNYIGYAYSYSAIPNLSSGIVQSAASNVFITPPTNVTSTYLGSNITINWNYGSVNYFTVKQISNNTTISSQSNITTCNVTFTGSIGSNYSFTVQAQSAFSTNPSLIYSSSNDASTRVALVTSNVQNLSAGYYSNTITLSWDLTIPNAINYIYTISQTLGPLLTFNQPIAGSSNVTIYNVPISNTYQFSVLPTLYGISGQSTLTSLVNLSTASMLNVSQSYTGNTYTISWSPISANYYTIFDKLNNYQPVISTTNTIYNITNLSYGLSYQFQTFATYKGISGSTTTLSAIYLYTVSPSTASATYSGATITVNWSNSTQADGNTRPTSNYIYDTLSNITIVKSVPGNITTISFDNLIKGSSYQFGVYALYNGISSSTTNANTVFLNTNPVIVNVDNSGSNLYISWQATITPGSNIYYSIRQIPGGPTVLPQPVTTTNLSYLTTAVNPNPTAFYNFGVTAVVNGISSTETSAASPAIVYTFPPTNLKAYYSGDFTLSQTKTSIITSFTPTTQNNVIYYSYFIDQNNNKTIEASSNSTPINVLGSATVSSTYTPYLYATRNGLRQSVPDISASPITLYTDPPSFAGIGFNGNYVITVNISAELNKKPDKYTLIETSSNFYPGDTSWPINPAPLGNNTIFSIPATGTQGLTYTFGLYSTLCGLTSPEKLLATISLDLITKPVDSNKFSADYNGRSITITWSDAIQCNARNPTVGQLPNGGYTLYSSSQTFPLTTLYNPSKYVFVGTAGTVYQFSIQAVNNNVGSSIITSSNANVYLYKPVVNGLIVTNSGAITPQGSNYAVMTLNWNPDPSAPNASYKSTLYDSNGSPITSTITTATTTTFNGSLDTLYFFGVQGIYKGISGDFSTTSIRNTRPVLSNVTITNLGNFLNIQYVANVYSYFSISITSPNGGTASLYSSNNTSSVYSVTSSIGAGFTYNISAIAFYNGLPSLTCNQQYTMVKPNPASGLTFNYNNTLVTSTWVASGNASTYTFTALDVGSNVLVNTQPNLVGTTASFNGSVGRTYNISLYAFSSTNIPSTAIGTTGTIVIPSPPTNLTLSNFGQVVTVSWTSNSSIYSGYSFYVSDILQRATVIYSNLYALPGDTFQGVAGKTYAVSLYGTSLCNVTSTTATSNNIFVYQPSISFVSVNNVGADNTLTFPQDSLQTCVFLVKDNNGLSTLLFPDPNVSKSGWVLSNGVYVHDPRYNNVTNTSGTYSINPNNPAFVNYTLSNNAASLAGIPYIYFVTPIFNGISGNTVNTSTTNPITLYKPTSPYNLTVTGTAYNTTINWQSSVIYTTPAQSIQSYIVEIAPQTGQTPTYPYQSNFVIGNSKTYTNYDSAAGFLTISVTAVTSQPLSGLPNPIYGSTANNVYIVPSTTAVSITQLIAQNPNLLTINVPVTFAGATNTKFDITAVGSNGTATNSVTVPYNSIGTTYLLSVSLGFKYTIAASLYSNTNLVGSSPANQNQYFAVTFPVSNISASHNGYNITVSWPSVIGAGSYSVRSTTSTLTSNTTGNSVVFTNDGNTNPFVGNSNYSYIVTAFTPTTNIYTTPGINSSNLGSLPTSTLPVNLTVPPSISNLTVTQNSNSLVVNWPIYNGYQTSQNNSDVGTPSYQVSLRTGATVISNYSGNQNTVTFNNILTNTTYTLSYLTTYLGISGPSNTTTYTTTAATITSATIKDGNNTKALLSASSPTSGTWYLGTTQIAVGSSFNNYDLGTFGPGAVLNRTVSFVDANSGLSNSSIVSFTFPNPTISSITTTDTGLSSPRTFNLNLAAAITNPCAGAVVNWTVLAPTGTTTSSTCNATGTSTSIQYTILSSNWPASATFATNSIYYDYDGFRTYYTSPVTFNTNFDLTIITPTLYVATNGVLTLTAGIPSGITPISWSFPSSIGGLSVTSSNFPASNSIQVFYNVVSTNTTYTVNPGQLIVAYEGYSNSNSYAISNTLVNFSITSATFADKGDGINAILTLTYGSYSGGGTGETPAWYPPQYTSNGGGYYQLTGNLGPFYGSPISLYYSNTRAGYNYAISANTIGLKYSGVTITYISLLTASSPNPIISSVTNVYSGSIEDLPTQNYININLSGNSNGTWSVPTPTGLTLSGFYNQGTSNAIAQFTGGRKGQTYAFNNITLASGGFTSSPSNTSVTLTVPTGTVTTTFNSFILDVNSFPVGIKMNVSPPVGSNFALICKPSNYDGNYNNAISFTSNVVGINGQTALNIQNTYTICSCVRSSCNIFGTTFTSTNVNFTVPDVTGWALGYTNRQYGASASTSPGSGITLYFTPPTLNFGSSSDYTYSIAWDGGVIQSNIPYSTTSIYYPPSYLRWGTYNIYIQTIYKNLIGSPGIAMSYTIIPTVQIQFAGEYGVNHTYYYTMPYGNYTPITVYGDVIGAGGGTYYYYGAGYLHFGGQGGGGGWSRYSHTVGPGENFAMYIYAPAPYANNYGSQIYLTGPTNYGNTAASGGGTGGGKDGDYNYTLVGSGGFEYYDRVTSPDMTTANGVGQSGSAGDITRFVFVGYADGTYNFVANIYGQNGLIASGAASLPGWGAGWMATYGNGAYCRFPVSGGYIRGYANGLNFVPGQPGVVTINY